MKNAVVYIHGKGGTAEEAAHYKQFFDTSFEVIGFDYKAETPWDAKVEFSEFFNAMIPKYDRTFIIANSLGAYFSLLSLSNKKIEKAMLISPVVDMERLILDMMSWANVTEEELKIKKEIETSFGERLSWEYLSYVRQNPIVWNTPTSILYGGKDGLTSLETMTHFAEKIKASLTIMKDGEHWFHTDKQIKFLDKWFKDTF